MPERVKITCGPLAALLFLACGSLRPCVAAEQVWTLGGLCGAVIEADGTAYVSVAAPPNTCLRNQGPWMNASNVFAAAGRVTGGKIVGVGSTGQLVSSTGDEYQLSSCSESGLSVTYVQNIFEFTGMEPLAGEEFTGYGPGPGYAFAVTSAGRVFRRLLTGCDPLIWQYVGSYRTPPVEALRRSWGALKLTYR